MSTQHNNAKRRREERAARKVQGRDAMDPRDPRNLERIIRQQAPRAERRGGRTSA